MLGISHAAAHGIIKNQLRIKKKSLVFLRERVIKHLTNKIARQFLYVVGFVEAHGEKMNSLRGPVQRCRLPMNYSYMRRARACSRRCEI